MSSRQEAAEAKRRRQEEIHQQFLRLSNPLRNNKYRLLRLIGEGAYGQVMMAQNQITGERVAVKRILRVIESQPMATRILRELKFLRLLSQHENIIKVKDVLIPDDHSTFNDVFVVLELMPADLSKLLRSNNVLRPDHVKWFMFQLLKGIHFMHTARVFHRDLKPNNLLINTKCELRICDFGLARASFQNGRETYFWTDYVSTRWYRAPELIMKEDKEYSTAIDIWSIGCIFAEILSRGHVLFPGKNGRNQYELITEVLGTPSAELLDKLGCTGRNLLGYKPPKPFRELFPEVDPAALSLLEQMLAFDPDERISAYDALHHPYFSEYLHLGLGAKSQPLPSEEFAFERVRMTPAEMRLEFLKEILHYHPGVTMEMITGQRTSTSQYPNDSLSKDSRDIISRRGLTHATLPTKRFVDIELRDRTSYRNNTLMSWNQDEV